MPFVALASTQRFGDGPALSVRTLRAEVLEGPDHGLDSSTLDEELAIGTAKGNGLVLADETVSRFHLVFKRTDQGVLVVDQRSTNGTYVGAVRLGAATVAPGTVVRLGRTQVRIADGQNVDVELHGDDSLGPLRGRSPAMRRVMAWVKRAAASDASVLLVGESGTGKEVVARAIHETGPRAEGPFVVVDCGALAPNLVASELFGHERGAFTGAERQRAGALELAQGGTIFLDEIGELPRELQPALLGALERRSFRRVGGSKEIEVDVRVVAATNRDLRSEVNGGSFRLDLYYRLAVLTLELPALRERREDIALLLEHFLRSLGYTGTVESLFPPESVKSLMEHSWPGNVRELRNVAHATIALGQSPLRPEPGPDSGDANIMRVDALFGLPFKEARQEALHAFEERYLRHALDLAGDNVSQAARNTGLDRSYLFSLLRRAGLR